MYLTLCQFWKKDLIRYVLWKVSNFALIFYVIRTLHKKSRQSLRPSTGRIGWDFFSKIGIKWGTYFSKKVPIFETFWFTPAMHRPLTVKGVYVVSHSWYVQVFELVCTSKHFYEIHWVCSIFLCNTFEQHSKHWRVESGLGATTSAFSSNIDSPSLKSRNAVRYLKLFIFSSCTTKSIYC